MRKKLIPMILAVILLTANMYASEAPAPVQADEAAAVSVTDITPREQSNYTGTLPDILPLDVQLKDENGSSLLVKTFEVPPDTDARELVEEKLARGGVEYTLREILKETLQSGTDSRAEIKTVTVSDTRLYTGDESEQTEDGYLVTTSYSIEVKKAIPGNIRYKLVYEPIQQSILPKLLKNFDWREITPIALIAIIAGSLAAVVFFVLRILLSRKKNTGFDTGMVENKPKRRKPHALGYMKRDEGLNDAPYPKS